MCIIHKWIDKGGDGQAVYQECKKCGKRRIFSLALCEKLWRKEWEQARKCFLETQIK